MIAHAVVGGHLLSDGGKLCLSPGTLVLRRNACVHHLKLDLLPHVNEAVEVLHLVAVVLEVQPESIVLRR